MYPSNFQSSDFQSSFYGDEDGEPIAKIPRREEWEWSATPPPQPREILPTFRPPPMPMAPKPYESWSIPNEPPPPYFAPPQSPAPDPFGYGTPPSPSPSPSNYYFAPFTPSDTPMREPDDGWVPEARVEVVVECTSDIPLHRRTFRRLMTPEKSGSKKRWRVSNDYRTTRPHFPHLGPIPFRSDQRILIIGDGDFSFAAGLMQRLGTARNLVVTSIEDYDALGSKYQMFKQNVRALMDSGAIIGYYIDATRPPMWHESGAFRKLGLPKAFDVIVWNYPHTTVDNADLNASASNIAVLQDFFNLMPETLEVNGKIYMSWQPCGVYLEWQIEKMPLRNPDLSFVPLEPCSTKPCPIRGLRKWKGAEWPGYTHKHTNRDKSAEHVEERGWTGCWERTKAVSTAYDVWRKNNATMLSAPCVVSVGTCRPGTSIIVEQVSRQSRLADNEDTGMYFVNNPDKAAASGPLPVGEFPLTALPALPGLQGLAELSGSSSLSGIGSSLSGGLSTGMSVMRSRAYVRTRQRPTTQERAALKALYGKQPKLPEDDDVVCLGTQGTPTQARLRATMERRRVRLHRQRAQAREEEEEAAQLSDSEEADVANTYDAAPRDDDDDLGVDVDVVDDDIVDNSPGDADGGEDDVPADDPFADIDNVAANFVDDWDEVEKTIKQHVVPVAATTTTTTTTPAKPTPKPDLKPPASKSKTGVPIRPIALPEPKVTDSTAVEEPVRPGGGAGPKTPPTPGTPMMAPRWDAEKRQASFCKALGAAVARCNDGETPAAAHSQVAFVCHLLQHGLPLRYPSLKGPRRVWDTRTIERMTKARTLRADTQ